MVTKGLDFPRVTLVGVLTPDQMLYADDFRSYERTFSLITQVVGRSGRRAYAYFAFRRIIRARHQRDNPANGVHHHGSDGSRHQKRHKGSTHDFSCAANPLHIGDGRGNGAEHHGYHHAEHQVDKYRPHGLQAGSTGPYGAYGASGYNGQKHAQQEPVLLEKLFHVLNSSLRCRIAVARPV